MANEESRRIGFPQEGNIFFAFEKCLSSLFSHKFAHRKKQAKSNISFLLVLTEM